MGLSNARLLLFVKPNISAPRPHGPQFQFKKCSEGEGRGGGGGVHGFTVTATTSRRRFEIGTSNLKNSA